jgi:hypothetical protein
MHSNLSITDGVYGILSDTDIQKQIASLGNTAFQEERKEEITELIKQLLHNALSICTMNYFSKSENPVIKLDF